MAVLGGANLMVRKLILSGILALIGKLLLDWYLKTKSGLLLRATGNNAALVTTLARDKGAMNVLI